jgi:putative membrane protein
MMSFDGFMGGFGLVGLIWLFLIVAFWTVVIVLGLLAIRWLIRNTEAGQRSGHPGEDTALAVLRERFARGEIDAAEFEERKRLLGG